MKKTFTYNDDKSSKFWSIEVNGKSFTVNYGKTGTNGQAQTKTFDSEEKCQKEAEKLIVEKTKKGYAEEGAISTTLASSTKTIVEEQVQKAKQLLDELNEWLERKGIEDRIEFSEPVLQTEIVKAEKTLSVRLPTSYVTFVTRYGFFEVGGDLLGMGLGNYTSLFSPREITEQTQQYRKEFENLNSELNEDDDSEEMEEYKILKDGLIYLASPHDECFEIFVISSADDTGEMQVRHFDYQDLGMNDGWHEGNKTFYNVIEEMVNNIKQENE